MNRHFLLLAALMLLTAGASAKVKLPHILCDKLLVEQWRQQLGLGEIPFYFVQIAPFESGNSMGTWDEALMVVSPEVKGPVPVRYCFRNLLLDNLGNMGGLPLFPFRTDDRE